MNPQRLFVSLWESLLKGDFRDLVGILPCFWKLTGAGLTFPALATCAKRAMQRKRI